MKKALYFGLEVPSELRESVVHCPLIEVVPRNVDDSDLRDAFAQFEVYTHLLFTSKSAIAIFCRYAPLLAIDLKAIKRKKIIAVGTKTASQLHRYQLHADQVAKEETQEGVINLLQECDLSNAHLFWPHSARSRPLLETWMKDQKLAHTSCVFYDTVNRRPDPLPHLNEFDELVFTSPSTVDAFFEIFGELPPGKRVSCIGPITKKHLLSKLFRYSCQ